MFKLHRTHSLVPALIATLVLSPAQAQSLEEVFVTATKRPQTLQDVPVAVSVTSGDTLDQAQIIDVADLQSVVPSLRITQLQTSGNTNFVIRGFGNGANNVGIEPSVGVFIDGVYRSRSSGAISDLTNIERVEVLRGPQSTLFGKNASAGVISVITAKPDFEFGGNAELTVGNLGQVIGRARVTGPLSDKIAFSLAASANQRDGYFENRVTGTEFNERERWAVRGQLIFEPTDNTEIRVLADMDRIDEICCGVANLVDGPTGAVVRGVGGNLTSNQPFARSGFFNIDSVNDIENSGVSVQVDHDFANFALTSITSFRKQEKFENADSDFTSADLLGRNTLLTDLETLTQEIRFTSTNGEKLDWMIGAFYFNEDVAFANDAVYGTDFRNYADLLAMGAVSGLEPSLGVPAGTFFQPGQGTFDRSGQDDQALSIFGQLDWHVADGTTITLGANHTNNEKDAFVTVRSTDTFSALDFTAIGFAGLFSAFTGGAAPTPANFAMFPAQFAAAQAASTAPCTPASAPGTCNAALALQPLQFLPQFVNFPNAVESGKSDDSETTWTVRIAQDLTDDINVYFNVSTGFKATSWNLSRDSRPFPADLAAIQANGLSQPNLTTGTRFAGPEEATVYEVGAKARFAQGSVNIAVFDQKIEGFQSNIFTGTGFALANAGEQSTQGIEIDGQWIPTENLTINFAGTFLDPIYNTFVGGNGPNGPEDLTGTKPAGIHEISANVSGVYSFVMGNGADGFVRGEYQFEEDVQVVENVTATVASRDVSVFNASAGIAWANGLELTLWGRNLFEDDYLLSAFPSVAQSGSFSGYPNQPRTFGVTVRKRFGQ
ncbi:MAG: TonB-dependent receptor [Gammaproteobacteria bacterium]|nr:TonB-dependent receptor [Gammaproteobacteria bacterium]